MKTRITSKSLLEHGFTRVRLPNGQIIYCCNGIAVMWAFNKWFCIVLIHGRAYLQQVIVEFIEDIP